MSNEQDSKPGVRILDSTANNNQRVTIRARSEPQESTIQAPQGFAAEMPGVNVQRAEDRRMQFKASDLAPKRSGLLASATTKSGMTAQTLTPDTLVQIPASNGRTIQATLAQAEQAGLVRRNPQTGEYVEVTGEERAAEAQAEQQEASAKLAEDMSFGVERTQETNEFLNDLHTALTQANEQPELAMLTAFTEPEKFVKDILPKISADQPGAMKEVWSDIQATIKEAVFQVRSLCAAERVNFETFATWLEQSGVVRPETWKAAALQVLNNDARSMKSLLSRYKQTRSASDEPIPEGVNVRRSYGARPGAAYVTVRGPDGRTFQASVATLQRMGLMHLAVKG